MERVLIKLARQLNAYDEASLMSLWDKYAETVQEFEPSKRWEESVLVFSLIQALRWKNQLFNYHWSAGSRPLRESSYLPPLGPEKELLDFGPESGSAKRPGKGEVPGKRAKVLRFRPRKGDEPV